MSADELSPTEPFDPRAVSTPEVAADAAVPEANDVPLDPINAATLAQLESGPEQKTWLQSLLLLVVSLALFGAAGLFSYTLPDLLVLIAVLLFHESGHYLGMRLFNYRDVRMFFIPFFGAAVSGRSTSVAGYKEAIVILLGPLPGIVLGIVLGAACLFYDEPLLRSATRMLLLINGFNLLPFLPLDGGRLLHLVLFSRQRHLEAVFRVVTGALLALAGWAIGAWILMGLGVLILLATGYTFRISTLAMQLRGQHPPSAEMDLSARVPGDQAVRVLAQVRQAFPKLLQPRQLATAVRQVWERMHIEPPGVLASCGLLAVYVGSLLGTPVAALLLHFPWPRVASVSNADGTVSRQQEVRVLGRLQQSTQLGSDGGFEGRHIEYFPMQPGTAVEGSFAAGQRHGAWKFFTPEGNVQAELLYDHGKLIEQKGELPAGTTP